jgi:hypothetical protein
MSETEEQLKKSFPKQQLLFSNRSSILVLPILRAALKHFNKTTFRIRMTPSVACDAPN